jgi:hypothetical protein
MTVRVWDWSQSFHLKACLEFFKIYTHFCIYWSYNNKNATIIIESGKAYSKWGQLYNKTINNKM